MFGFGHWEWILIFLVVLLIFGGKKLPEVARGLGKAMQEFRKARDELHDAINEKIPPADKPEDENRLSDETCQDDRAKDAGPPPKKTP